MVFLVAGLVGCKNNSVMNGKFNSMDDCLTAIKHKTGKEFNVVVDKPENVTGYLLGTKLNFQCEVEETGTQGAIVKGWYEVED